ncbi:hypothetical protein CZ787_13690 [Halomonas citrativorans]|uniref:Uncharacterized protein n=1 Tax=Halomonas citrativorans TaxID=2742612 RepID=A0A1R4I313_9GAMM|nr:hypothetical protein CZ787_13690 [Halomonas citrativorans]
MRHGKTPETRVRPPRTPWIRPLTTYKTLSAAPGTMCRCMCVFKACY